MLEILDAISNKPSCSKLIKVEINILKPCEKPKFPNVFNANGEENFMIFLILPSTLIGSNDENKIKDWLNEAGLKIKSFKYQNYDTHTIENDLEKKDFIICIANKINND